MLPALVSQHLPRNVLFYIYCKRTQRTSSKSSSLVFLFGYKVSSSLFTGCFSAVELTEREINFTI